MTKKATTAELVERYNKAAATLGRKAVKKFADRKTAERRVAAIEAEMRPAANTAVERDNIGNSARGLTFNLPGRPAKDRVEPREGSMRAAMLALLEAHKSGLEFEEIHQQIGFANRRSTYDALRLLNRVNGYGLAGTDANVKLKLN